MGDPSTSTKLKQSHPSSVPAVDLLESSYAFLRMIRTEMGLFMCPGECRPWDSAVTFGNTGVQVTGSNSAPHLLTRLEVPFLLLEPPSLSAGRDKVHIHPSRRGREISDHAEVMDP